MSRTWTLFDYGVGNLHSLRKALALHVDVEVTRGAHALADAAAIVLPGVGAFGSVMEALAPAAEALRRHHAEGRPLLGVCIGMQVLYDQSEEAPGTPGLGIVPGTVHRIDASAGKVPHMGWNMLSVETTLPPLPTRDERPAGKSGPKAMDGAAAATPPGARVGAGTPPGARVGAGTPPGAVAGTWTPPSALASALAAAGHVYYVHSYAAAPGPTTLATSTYGAPFAAALRTGNTIAFQFHPEKSSLAGKAILGAALQTLEDA